MKGAVRTTNGVVRCSIFHVMRYEISHFLVVCAGSAQMVYRFNRENSVACSIFLNGKNILSAAMLQVFFPSGTLLPSLLVSVSPHL